jgi:hypothetical protein
MQILRRNENPRHFGVMRHPAIKSTLSIMRTEKEANYLETGPPPSQTVIVNKKKTTKENGK